MNTPPTVIQRYRILKQIGQGGMGALYLAEDPALDRLTAIKVLREDNEELRQRFAREARSAARLSHVNIVTIYDVGEHLGQPFIAMEYVQGKTLAELIRQRAPVTMRQKLDWMYEICDGLEHAHRAQIIHRDIKPANIMIAANGRVKILDFGIARLGESSMTQAGMLVGTLNYMSPEQIMGQPVNARSDIFAVGAVCYELLCYKQAFAGGLDSGILHRILSIDPESIDALCPGVDPDVARIVMRAMAKDPETRYADLSVMRRELDRVRQRFSIVDGGATIASRPGDETMAVETPSSSPRSQVPRSQVPRSERRKSGRESLEKRRATELASYIASAREAFQAGRLEDALAACERALLLDEDNREATELHDRARAAIDAQQISRWLDEARQAVDGGTLTRAAQLLDQALALAPDSADAAALAAQIRKERERLASVSEAIAQGRRALDEGAHERAVAAANLAVALDPGNEDAQAILSEAQAAIAAIRRQQELDKRAEKAIADAQTRFARGELDEALTLLQAFSPAHPAVTAALQTLREEAREIKRRRKAEEERLKQIADQADLLRRARASIGTGRFDEARRLLAEADAMPIDNADIAVIAGEIGEAEARARADAERQAADAEAARRAREEAARKAEEERRRAAEDAAQRKQQEEAARRAAAEEAARRKQEEDARRKAEEEQRRAAAEAARREKEEAARREKEAERQRKEEAARLKREADQREKEEAAKRKAEEASRREEERKRASEAARERVAKDAAARAAAEAAGRASDATVIVPSGVVSVGDAAPVPAPRPLPVKAIGGGIAAVLAIAVAIVLWKGGSDEGDNVTTTSSVAPTTTVVSVAPTTTAATTSAVGITPPATSSAVSPPAATASLVINALPWAEVVEVRDSANQTVPVSAGTYTPVVIPVAPGTYSVTLRNPYEGGSRTVSVTVDASGGRAFAEFRKISAEEYFSKVGR